MAVITGRDENHSARSDAQVIDMGSSSTGCRSLTNYPLAMTGASGGLIANELIICGGSAGSPQTACYKYSPSEHQWTIFAHLQTGRKFHATTPLDDNRMWITGKPYFS